MASIINDDMLFGLLYLVSFICSIFLILVLSRTGNAGISRRLIIMTVLVAFWNLMEALSFFTNATEFILLFQKLKYIGVIFVPPVLLITSILFINKLEKLNRLQLGAVFIIPVLSLCSVLTERFPYHFMTGEQIRFVSGIPTFTYIKDTGFIVNAAYSYILIIATCYLLFMRAIKSPKIYRVQSMFVFIGCSVTFLINILFITQKLALSYIDTTPISILLTLVIFYWGVYQLPKSMIVPYARDLVIENIKDLVIIVDNYDCIIDVNPAAFEFITQQAEQKKSELAVKSKLVGMKIHDLLKDMPKITVMQSFPKLIRERTLALQGNDDVFYFLASEEPIFDSDRVKIGRLHLFHDITQMQKYLFDLEQLNKDLVVSDTIINDALEGVIITDAKSVIIRVNDSLVRMSGYAKEELIGQNPRILKSDRHDTKFFKDMWEEIAAKGFWEGEIWDRKKSGEVYPKWMSITTIYHPDGAAANYIGISSDISKMKKAENDIELLAYYDALTGIPNRTLFYDRLKTSLSRIKQSGKGVALFFMDLDRFKVINDSMGHAAGDELLIQVASRIKSRLRESDTVSRLGGDEFTVIVEDIETPEDAKKVAESIMNEIQKPYHIWGREVSVGVSIGIAIAPYDETTVEGMIRKADIAMYHAKETGRGKYAFSSEELEKRSQEIMEMQIRLKEALINKEFVLFLQPQLAFSEGHYKITGAEALIRWKVHGGEIIPPDRFIPAAEANGLIISIGSWVIEEVFRMDRILKANGIKLKLAFNVSVKQFENRDLIHVLNSQLEAGKNRDSRFVVEITESMFINDIEKSVEYLEEIKKLGLEIALDDFGTGFSSLSYLTRLPIDYLKIDKSFVSNMDNLQHRNLINSILSMAKTLRLKTLAEGIETNEQADKLIAEACDELQGFYFSKPLELKDFIEFVNSWE